jgi:large subunit ribosomal protein L29
MKASELRDKDEKALRKELTELRREGFKLRMQQGTGQLGRPSEIKRVRRDVARVLTALGKREQASKASKKS